MATRMDGTGLVVIGRFDHLGRAVVLEALDRGARVVCGGQPDQKWSSTRPSEVDHSVADRFTWVTLEGRGDDQLDRLFDVAADRLLALNAVINLLGAPGGDHPARSVLDVTEEAWEATAGAPLRDAFRLSRRAVEEFIGCGTGGHLVHVAEDSCQGSFEPVGPAAALAGLGGFVRTVALEYGPIGIACNAVVATPPTESNGPIPLRGLNPIPWLPRRGSHQTDRAVETTLVLVSGDIALINGEVIRVPGSLPASQV